ncbi:MAG: DUF2029 domain-containing protein, partial [Chitinophagales bacterium]|nr:DUF2029 domain-containing protein [Hyphomicrobiales bacterium]
LLGLFIRLIWFGSPAPLENDFYRYLWDGAMLAHGFNPYTLSPAQVLDGVANSSLPHGVASLALESGELLRSIQFAELRTIYPGTAQTGFAAAHLIAPRSLDSLRLVLLLADGLTFLLLMSLMRVQTLNPLWACLYWCNPFVSFTMIGIAHADALIAPFLLGGLVAQIRGRSFLACALLGLAAGVKLWPILIAPLLLRPHLAQPKRLLIALACLGATMAVTVLPLIYSTLSEGSGLTAYAGGWWNNNAIFAWAAVGAQAVLPENTALTVLRGGMAAIAAAVAFGVAAKPWTTPAELTSRALAVAATVFLCSPAQFPWYASWFLPLAALHRFWPLLAMSALLPAYYLFFPLWGTAQYDLFAYGIAFVHAVPILLWLGWRGSLAVSPQQAALIDGACNEKSIQP